MANTISGLSLANTFNEWMIVTNQASKELNYIGKSDWHKDTGTLFLDDTGVGLQANTITNFTKKVNIYGEDSSLEVEKEIVVTSGQVKIQNTTLGLINSGAANIGGILNALAPNTGLYVANTANISGRMNVTGAATLSNTLSVTGNTILSANLSVTNDIGGNNVFVTNTTNTRNIIYSGTLTGGTGVISIGPNQINKDAVGNVGIGTAATGFRVSIAGATPSSIPLYLSSDATNAYVYTPNALFTGTTTSYPIVFVANSVPIARFDSAGKLGIGTQSPTANLHVIGDSIVSGSGYFNDVQSNARVNTATLTVTGNTTTDILQANTSVNTALVTTTTLNVRNVSANNLSSNSLTVAGNTVSNNITSNNSVATATLRVTGNTNANVVIANTISSNTIMSNTLNVSANIYAGNIYVYGSIVQSEPWISSSNTTTINDNSPSLRNASFNVYRPGVNTAQLRWNETAKYWDFLDVANTSLPYYKILTTNNVSGLSRAITVSDGGTGKTTFTTGNVISYDGSTLISLPRQTLTTANLGTGNTITTVTLDSYGRVSSINAVPISIGVSQIVGLNPTAAGIDTTNATNISTGTLSAARLPASGVVGGTYGNTTQIPIITIDSTGRVNTATTTGISTRIKLQADLTTGNVSGGGTLSIRGTTPGISVSIPFNTNESQFNIENTGVTSLTGTLNQVSVSGSTGSVTLSLPQTISSNSSPSFVKVTANLDAKIANSVNFFGTSFRGTTGVTAQFTGNLIGIATSSLNSANSGLLDNLPLQPNKAQISSNQVARSDSDGNMRLSTIIYTAANEVALPENVTKIFVTQNFPNDPNNTNMIRTTGIATLSSAVQAAAGNATNKNWNISVLGNAGNVAAAGITGTIPSSKIGTTTDYTVGSLTTAGNLTTTAFFKSSNVVSQSLTNGALVLNGSAGAMVLDDGGHKRISWNDGGGNFNIRAGNYFNGTTLVYARGIGDTVNSGAAGMTFNTDGVDGSIVMYVANTGAPGTAASFSNTITLDSNGFSVLSRKSVIGAGATGYAANSSLWVKGDVTSDRSDGSGVMYLGGTGGYIYYNNTDYSLGPVAGKTNNFYAPGKISCGNHLQTIGQNVTSSLWYSAFFRNDGNDAGFLNSPPQSTSTAAIASSWNNSRPFSWNLTTGAVAIDRSANGTTIGGKTSIGTGTTDFRGQPAATPSLYVKGDITSDRGSGNGVVYLGATGGYIYYNGSDYSLGSVTNKTNSLTIPGGLTCTGISTTSVRTILVNNSANVGTDGVVGQIELKSPLTESPNTAGISFHRPGAYAVNMGLDPDNIFRLGGWSDGLNKYRWTSDSAGNLIIGNTLTANNVKFRNVLSSDVNTLDAYTEGTWAPVLTFDSQTVAPTYSTQQGSYTRIGNRVFFDIALVLTSKGTAQPGGLGSISLPINSTRNTSCSINYSNLSQVVTSVHALVEGNNTRVRVDYAPVGSLTTGQMPFSIYSNSTILYLSGTYTV